MIETLSAITKSHLDENEAILQCLARLCMLKPSPF